MKKKLSAVMTACMLMFALAACGNTGNNAEESTIPEPDTTEAPAVETESKAKTEESTPPADTSEETTESQPEPEDTAATGLVVYFSWSGNTESVAVEIQNQSGADTFRLVPAEPYTDDYDTLLDIAQEEQKNGARPAISGSIENFDSYEVVYLGYPNWWYTAPMAIFSFIEEYDFSGKTVVPFCAHGTGGLAGSVTDITAALPDSTEVLEPIGVYCPDIDSAQPVINEWLEGFGFEEREADIEVENTERKLKMTVNGQEVAITLYDTPAANALYDMLPLDLNFEDFNGIEKISYLSKELPMEGEPDGCDPDVGDLCLYAPWGNLSIFYQDFRYSDSLIMLGHIDSGMDVISEMEENTSTVLEKAN